MKIAKKVIFNKTGEEGHIFYLDHEPKKDHVYYARFKLNNTHGYVARPCTSTQFTVVKH